MKLYEGMCNEDCKTDGVISREALHLLLICTLPPSLPTFCLFPLFFPPSLSSDAPSPAIVPPLGSTFVILQSFYFCSPSLSPPASSVCFIISIFFPASSLLLLRRPQTSHPPSSPVIAVFHTSGHLGPPAKTTKMNFLP